MAVSTDQHLHHSITEKDNYDTLGLPGMPLNSDHLSQKLLDLIPPSPQFYNNNDNKIPYPHPHHLQHHSSHEKRLLRHKLSKRLNMKRSFNLSNLKNSNSVDSHPLTDSDELNENDDSNNDDTELMELDEYDSDEVSCNSCLSTPSKSNFSFLFDTQSLTIPSIPIQKPQSYSNTSILSSLTGSTLSLSIPTGAPSSFPSRAYIPTSTSTVSCSPVTTVSIPASTSLPSTSGRDKSLCRSPSSDSLYVILKKSTPSPSPLGNNSGVKSMYSNLTSSLKSFRNKLSLYNKENLISYIVDSPRLTDDKLPQIPELENEVVNETDDPVDQDQVMQELTTFKSSGPHHCSNKLGLTRVKFKTREQRSNREFLRLYAFDHHARTKSRVLPNSMSPDEIKKIIKKHPHIKKFHYDYNIQRISNLSKDKLWSNVILPPRSDESPGLFIDGENYICIEEVDEDELSLGYSIVRKQGGYMPWVLKQSIRPAGVLPKSKCIFNSEAPNSGVTNCQFTVKGWCNPRWVDISKE